MPTDTHSLLIRWHAGDLSALGLLLEQHLPWIRDYVHRRLGPELRRKAETGDLVHDAVIQVLTYGPPFRVADDTRFRWLVARVAENVLRDRHDWFRRQRRDMARERPLPSDSAISLDPPQNGSTDTPSHLVHQQERVALVRLGLELLSATDREAIVLRDWEGLSFGEFAEKCQLTTEAATKRYQRAVVRLGTVIRRIRSGHSPQRVT